MEDVERAIRANLVEGTVLHTTARHAEFLVDRIDNQGMVLRLGEGRNPVRISWGCLEGVPAFLEGRGAIPIGGMHITEGQPGTLDEYLKTCVHVNTARWVAVVLAEAGVVGIVPGRPVRVRLSG